MNHDFERSDIVGIWKSKQGGIIEFKPDSTFICINLPSFIAGSTTDGKSVSGSGIWFYSVAKDGIKVDISFNNSNTSTSGLSGYTTVLNVTKGGLLENTLPWYLYFWEDVESGKRYKFYK